MQVAGNAGGSGRNISGSGGAINCANATASFSVAQSGTSPVGAVVTMSFNSNVAGARISDVMAGSTRLADAVTTCNTASGLFRAIVNAGTLTSAPQTVSWNISDPSNPGVSTACAATVSTGSYPDFLVGIDSSGSLTSGQNSGVAGCIGALSGSGSGPAIEVKVSQVGGLAGFAFKVIDGFSGIRRVLFAFDANDGTPPEFGSFDPTEILRISHPYGAVGNYLPRLSVIDSRGMRSQVAMVVKNYIATAAPGNLPLSQTGLSEGTTLLHRGNILGGFDFSNGVVPTTLQPLPPTDVAVAGDGAGNSIFAWHLPTKIRLLKIQVFGSTYVGGTRPFIGDLLGNGSLVVGGGSADSAAKVKYYSAKTLALLGENDAYGSAASPFAGGLVPAIYRTSAGANLFVAAQGLNGSGAIRFFQGIDPERGYTFYPFGTTTSQMRTSSGYEELAAVTNSGAPTVRIFGFDPNVTQASQILQLTPSGMGANGGWVALSYPGDLNQGLSGNIAIGTTPTVVPTRVRMYSRGSLTALWDVTPWGTSEDCGARISTAYMNGIPVVIAAPGAAANSGGALPVKVYNAVTGAELTALQYVPLDVPNRNVFIASIPFIK